MDYLPLALFAIVLVGALIVLRYLVRLKKAAVRTLEEVRRLDAQLQSLKSRDLAGAEEPPAHPDGPPPG